MLKIKREDLKKSQVKLTIDIPKELMRGYFTKTYNKLAPEVEVKGFRKGNAPKNLTIMAIGENRMTQEIVDLALSETYAQALKQENIIPVSAPRVNVKMMKDLLNDEGELQYEVEIDLLPEVELGDYKKLKITKSKEKEIQVTDEEVDKVLGHLQRQHATFEPKITAAESSDRVEIDFTGTERGVVLENLTSKSYPVILGTSVLLPDFEKNIVGMKKDEEKEFDLNMPKNRGEDKDKKENLTKIHFKVKMNDVQKVILPLMDDELAKKFQKHTIKDLRKVVTEDVKKQKETEQKQKEEGAIIEQLLKIAKIDLPESLVEQEVHRMIEDLRSRASMIGIPFEQYLTQIKRTEEDLHTDFHDQAEKTVKVGLVLGEIGKREKMDLSDKEAGHKVMDKLLSYARKVNF